MMVLRSSPSRTPRLAHAAVVTCVPYVACLALVAACGSDAGSGGATAPSTDPSSPDAGGEVEDGTPRGKGDDAASGDAAADAPPQGDGGDDLMNPHPPKGATVCGSGPVTSAAFQDTCTAPSSVLDWWAGGAFPRACGAVTFTSASYTVWCTADTAYVFVHYIGLHATGTLTCKGASAFTLSAVWDSGSGGGDLGVNVTSGYRGAPYDAFSDTAAIDVSTWVTTSRKSRSARIYLAPLQEPLGQCGQANAGYRTVVGGAKADWQ